MNNLPEQFCPHTHEHPITAIAYDSLSQTLVTADESGQVAIHYHGESTPSIHLQHSARINNALALQQGGELLVVGDDDGTIAIYETRTGNLFFYEERSGARGRVRAFLGVSINPQGSLLASI